jgi:hypothetical protein
VGIGLERGPVEVVEVVVLAEGVEGDLPVGPHPVDVGLAIGSPRGEVEHGHLLGQVGAEVLVDVERLLVIPCTSGPEVADAI